jgi:hypothetical protein
LRPPEAVENEQIAVGKRPNKMRGIRRSSPRGERDPIGEAGKEPAGRRLAAGIAHGVEGRSDRPPRWGERRAISRWKGIGGSNWHQEGRGAYL